MTKRGSGGSSIEGGNPTRTESNAEATRIDRTLRDIWERHPRFAFIPNERSFFAKLQAGITALAESMGFPLTPPG